MIGRFANRVPRDSEIVCVVELPCRVGESPVWEEESGNVHFADFYGRVIHTVDPELGLVSSTNFPSTVGSFGLCRNTDTWVIAIGESVYLFNRRTKSLEQVVRPVPDGKENRLNDGKVGPDGAFWVGSIDDGSSDIPNGALYRVTADGRAECLVTGLKISNGLAWSRDGRTMFHSDSRGPWIDAWDFALDTGTPSNRRRIVNLSEPEGRPDGAATDVEGAYWSCGVSAGRINRFSPDGELIESVAVPVPAPTMPCFGGADMRTIFFTSLREGKDAETLRRFPLSGSLFAMRVDVEGVPVERFRN